MQLDLVDRRRHAGLVDQPLQMLHHEVGYADGFRASILLQLDQRAPRIEISLAAGDGPVDEIEIDIIELQTCQALVEGAQGAVVAVTVVPDLRGDEEFLALNGCRLDGCSHAFLVAVDGSRIDGAVARLDGLADGSLGFLVGDPPDAVAELRHGVSIVQADRGYGRHRLLH